MVQKSDQIGTPARLVSLTQTRARSYVSISSTRRGHVFSAGAPNARRLHPSLFPVTPASRSWKILSGHGRLPTKDPAFRTHVIILFTQYRSSSLPPSPRKKYALPYASVLYTLRPRIVAETIGNERCRPSRRKLRDFFV